MNTTAIEWTDYTWNPVTGCTPVSEGCRNCYARRVAQRLRGRFGYPADDPFRVTLHPEQLEEPLKLRKPSRIFVCSMGDLFHEDVDEKFIAKVFAIMDLARQHTYLVLTKRPARMQRLLSDEDFQFHVGWFQSMAVRELGLPEPKEIGPWPLRNVWAGVSVENQPAADERIPILLQTLAAVRYVSVEPMLGLVKMDYLWLHPECSAWYTDGMIRGQHPLRGVAKGLDWIICGGETGPGARPVHPDWVRNLRDQAIAAGVPFFFKGWGDWVPQSQADEDLYLGGYRSSGIEWPESPVELLTEDNSVYHVGKKAAGRTLDGRTWDQYPMRCERDRNAGAVGNE